MRPIIRFFEYFKIFTFSKIASLAKSSLLLAEKTIYLAVSNWERYIVFSRSPASAPSNLLEYVKKMKSFYFLGIMSHIAAHFCIYQVFRRAHAFLMINIGFKSTSMHIPFNFTQEMINIGTKSTSIHIPINFRHEMIKIGINSTSIDIPIHFTQEMINIGIKSTRSLIEARSML